MHGLWICAAQPAPFARRLLRHGPRLLQIRRVNGAIVIDGLCRIAKAPGQRRRVWRHEFWRRQCFSFTVTPTSRAMRCLWMLEEIGEPYQLIEKSTRPDDLQTTDYLRLNPNARIPTLVDGEMVLWESMAINIYLAAEVPRADAVRQPRTVGAGRPVELLGRFWNWRSCCSICCSHRAVLPEFARGPIACGTQRVAIAKTTRAW